VRRLVIAGAISAAGVAAGLFTLATAHDDSAFSFAGTSAGGAVALLGAGWALIGCGLAFWVRRPESRFGPLLAAAGFAWFVVEWPNPGIGSAFAFTVGLALFAACAPLAAHAVLAYPGGRLSSHLDRAALGVAYAGAILVLGVLPAFFFDPQAQGCSQCPRNLLLVSDRAALADDLTRAGIYAGVAWAAVLSALALFKALPAASSARPILAAGAVYLGLVAAMYAVSIDRGFLSPTTVVQRLWLAQAAALAAFALSVVWAWIRARRARSEVARLVVDLARAPAPGGLEDALRGIVGDPDLELAYPLADRKRLVDAAGRPVVLAADRERTSLLRDGRTVAVLAHTPGLLRDEQLVEEVTNAARLALENERLQAEVRAHLEELRASRARIVEAGDAERRRLERDLHDGAQQRLVALSLWLRLVRSQRPAEADPSQAARFDEADAELRAAIGELRELAHGIFPAVLADEGLAAAVEALAEQARVPLRIDALPEGRLDHAVETTAYTVVAEAARAATSALAVRAARSGPVLVVEVETVDLTGLDVAGLEDRVGALDGSLAVERRGNGRVTIRAVLPCAS
jgi:signal transduction histidine kinase